ncbi:pre-peptidase C-terminal domain-containing protein, partial [Desulforhopalus vacuolatus]|uniref:pre-peptidase C-terminal domain-containing protein n=1 Tax=Desulforhopalus vacuolatus TaxID=40414 RepID=UPI001964E914
SGKTYYVKVDPDGTSTSDYNLSINTVAAVTPVPSTNNDIINGEIVSGGDAGDSRTKATAVFLNNSRDAIITGYAGDNDYYKFVAPGGTATIELTGLSSDIFLRLLSSSGSTLESSTPHSSSPGESSSASISCHPTSGETYYVWVDPWFNNTSDYNLSINISNLDIINGTIVSGGDAGDSRTKATAVSLDSNGDASITGYAGDDDYYTFVAQYNGTAIIDLTGLSSNINLNLLSSGNRTLDSSTSGGSSSESVSCNFTSGETYYVWVAPYDNTSASDYNLSINTVAGFTPPSTNNDIINGEIVSGGDAGGLTSEAALVSLDNEAGVESGPGDDPYPDLEYDVNDSDVCKDWGEDLVHGTIDNSSDVEAIVLQGVADAIPLEEIA